MTATASYNGKVRANISGGGFSDLAGVNDVSVSLSRNLVDVSVMDASSDFIKRLATLKDFPISISGFFDHLSIGQTLSTRKPSLNFAYFS